MALPLNNTNEGGTTGVTITTANSGGGSGDAWDSVTIGGASTLTFDNTQAAHGNLSMKNGHASSATAFVIWSTSAGAQTTVYGRTYFYITANPAVSLKIVRALSGTITCATLVVTASGFIQFQDSANATLVTGTVPISLNAWNRIEWTWTFSTSVGSGSSKLFKTKDSTTVDETLSFLNANLGAASADTYRIGVIAAVADSTAFWLDDLQLNNTGFPGPSDAGFLARHIKQIEQAVYRSAFI